MVKNAASDAMQKTQEAASEATQKITGNAKGGDAIQGGLFNNYSQVAPEQAYEEYNIYLMKDEGIKQAFKLVRDVMLFTDKRIIFIDKTGVTGSKAKIQSINYFSIVEVELHTAGFRFDDSDLFFKYITTPNLRSINTEYQTKHLEFPRKFPVQDLYSELQELAYENCMKLHNMQ